LLRQAKERAAAEAAALERNATRFGDFGERTQPIPPEIPATTPIARRSLSSSELLKKPDTVRFNGAVEIDLSSTSREVNFTLGRDPKGINNVNTDGFSPFVSVNEPSISRTHAIFIWDPETRTLTIKDVGTKNMGSTYGTRIEGDLVKNQAKIVKIGDDRDVILIQCGTKTIKIHVGKKYLPQLEIITPPQKPVTPANGLPVLVSKPKSLQTTASDINGILKASIGTDYGVKAGISGERIVVEVTPNTAPAAVMRFYFPAGYNNESGIVNAVQTVTKVTGHHKVKLRVDFFQQEHYFALTNGKNVDGLVTITSGRANVKTIEAKYMGDGINGGLTPEALQQTEPPTIGFTVPFYNDNPSKTINALEGAIRKAQRATAPYDVL
jgi:hypothetical protein